MERDIDIPLAKSLLERWMARFPQASMAWNDRALFRSLNMAIEFQKPQRLLEAALLTAI
jgi:hypothetical protein